MALCHVEEQAMEPMVLLSQTTECSYAVFQDMCS